MFISKPLSTHYIKSVDYTPQTNINNKRDYQRAETIWTNTHYIPCQIFARYPVRFHIWRLVFLSNICLYYIYYHYFHYYDQGWIVDIRTSRTTGGGVKHPHYIFWYYFKDFSRLGNRCISSLWQKVEYFIACTMVTLGKYTYSSVFICLWFISLFKAIWVLKLCLDDLYIGEYIILCLLMRTLYT